MALEEDLAVQRDRLLSKLAEQRVRNAELWAWYRGRQDVPDVPAKYANAYRLFLEASATPWARLVVDSLAERLRVQGVRDTEAPDAADRAWRMFTRARLNADQRLIYTEALIGGTGYVSVSPDGIVPESSFEVTHEPGLADRQVVAAALKLYPLDWTRKVWVCELYRPEATYRWVCELARAPHDAGGFPIDEESTLRVDWDLLPDASANAVGVVPIVPFENRVNIVSGGASEIEDCVPVLQRIDRLTLDLLLTSHYASFRQKWATGLAVPVDPDTGQRVEPFKSAVERLWVNERADGSFGTFDASPPDGYLMAIDSQIATLAAISRVPAHYLLQRNLANPPSAESLIASEAGLVAKVKDRQAQYGEAWEQTFWLQSLMSGQPVEIETLEIDWISAEERNPAQTADAAIKMQQVGVPRTAIWAFLGFTPQQVAEFSQEEATRELLAAANAAVANQPPPNAPTTQPA